MAKKSKNPNAGIQDDIDEFREGEQVPGVYFNVSPTELTWNDGDQNVVLDVEVLFGNEALQVRLANNNMEVVVAIGNYRFFTLARKGQNNSSYAHRLSLPVNDLKNLVASQPEPGVITLFFGVSRSSTTGGINPATADDTIVAANDLREVVQKSFSKPEFEGKHEYLGQREVTVLGSLKLETFNPTEKVALGPAGREFTADQVLYPLIRARTLDFNRFKGFMDSVMCQNPQNKYPNRLPFPGVESYALLKAATEMYMMAECGFLPNNSNNGNYYNDPLGIDQAEYLAESARLGFKANDKVLRQLRNQYLERLVAETAPDPKVLPYLVLIRQKLAELPIKNLHDASNCYGILRSRLASPCMVELIWSYWQEQGMLVQTTNAILLRFQNIRSAGSERDPLFRLDVDPLRTLSNLLWGMVQDEQHTLSISRRAYEYDHEYGLTLVGRAVPQLRPVDSRSAFLEAFHNLLTACAVFYKDADDTTRIADGFPVLNSLREVHMLLAEGNHNAYGSLTWTARQEMLIQQWVLARPEFREFIGGRIMVPYREPWMDRVDMVKQMKGWDNTSVTHFHDLATYGEQLLLSVRYGNWSTIEDRNSAANWAIYWRNEVQRYLHSYRTVTGVDLSADAVDTTTQQRVQQPSVLLQRRLAQQLARGQANGQLQTSVQRRLA